MFEPVFRSIKLSILYLRCKEHADDLKRLVKYAALSILYLRCIIAALYCHDVVVIIAFNSLFEMP